MERQLRADIAFMSANGQLHFDAHFGNTLTDGNRLYLADLGLATSSRFDLSTNEQDFVARNLSHDAGYAMRELVNWMVANVAGVADPETGGPVERYDYVRRCAAGDPPANVPAPAAALLTRFAPVATIMNDFYWNLFGESRATPYPAEQIERAISSIPGDPAMPAQPARSGDG